MTVIRAARAEDAAVIAAIYAPHVTSGVASFELDPPDAGKIAARMAAATGCYPWLVAEEDGRILGYACASRFRERVAYRFAAETSVYLADDATGRGVGGLLYAALLDALRTQGLTQAMASISLPNPASEALHARLGFRAVGIWQAVGWKHGRWVDVALWQCPLGAPGDAPAACRTAR